MVNNLPPLAGPVDASGEPDEEIVVAMLAACEATLRHLWDIAGRFDNKESNAIRDEIHRLNAITLPSIKDLASRLKPAAAVPSSPAQPKPIRAHVPDCRKSLSVPVDLCSCGGRDFIPDPDFIKALPPSSPVADSDEIDEEEVPHPFRSRTRYEPGDDRDIWCADCEYHRDYRVHTSAPSPSAGAAQEIKTETTKI